MKMKTLDRISGGRWCKGTNLPLWKDEGGDGVEWEGVCNYWLKCLWQCMVLGVGVAEDSPSPAPLGALTGKGGVLLEPPGRQCVTKPSFSSDPHHLKSHPLPIS